MATADPGPVADRHGAGLLRDRRLLSLLIAGGVMAWVVIAVVMFTGAYFTSTSRSPGNEFAAASMGLTLSKTGQLVDGSGLAPGDSRSGSQTVTNNGHRGRLVLDISGDNPQAPLAQTLRVVVQQTSPAQAQPAYNGTLLGLSDVALGVLGTGDARTYLVTLTWPAGTGSSAPGTSTSLTFDWRIESVP